MRGLCLLAGLFLSLGITNVNAQTTAIVGGRVVTNDDLGVISEDGVVILERHRIVRVGTRATVAIPANARVIDAKGKWVTPGLFSPWSQVGLVEVAIEDETNETVAAQSNWSISLDVVDAFDPNKTSIPISRMEGVTRAVLAPISAQKVIDGQGALMDMSGSPASLFAQQKFVYVSLGVVGSSLSGGSRASAWAYLKAAFDDAANFAERYRGETRGELLSRSDANALRGVLDGRKMLVVGANRESDIRAVIRLKNTYPKVQIVILGAVEGAGVARELAAARIPVIIDPIDNLPANFEELGATPRLAKILNDAGVPVAISTVSSGVTHQIRLLPQHASQAVRAGLPWEKAFRAISATPAEIFGVGDSLGRLKSGYIADVVVWDGDPLEVMSAPTQVFIAGTEYPLVSRQTLLRDKYIVHPGK